MIPKDWEIKNLSQIGSFSKGKGISKTEANSGDIPAIRYGELYTKHHNIIRRFYSFINNQVARNSVKLKKGDLLFAGSGETKEEIGKSVAFVSDELAFVGGDIVILSPNKDCQSSFLGYLLNSKVIQKQKAANAQGDAVVHIYSNSLKDIQIPLPPLPEQEAIAGALSDSDKWIDSLEQLIAKKRLIKQGAMQELLTPKEGWEVKNLGDFNFDISDGNYSAKYPKSSEFRDNGIPFIRAVNIKNYKVVNKDLRYISPELHNELLKGHLKKGDILITNRGDIGQLALVGDDFIDANINAQIVRINTNQNLIDKYLLYWLSTDHCQNKINDLQTGSALKQLPINNLKKIEIKYPSLTEQTRIATILSDMDAELEALEQQLHKARQIKQGMMQELLTGRVRLEL